MAKATPKKRSRYEPLHRFWDGLVVLCFVVTVTAGIGAGVSISAIVWRSILVFIGLSFTGKILFRCWSSWDEVRKMNSPSSSNRK